RGERSLERTRPARTSEGQGVARDRVVLFVIHLERELEVAAAVAAQGELARGSRPGEAFDRAAAMRRTQPLEERERLLAGLRRQRSDALRVNSVVPALDETGDLASEFLDLRRGRNIARRAIEPLDEVIAAVDLDLHFELASLALHRKA